MTYWWEKSSTSTKDISLRSPHGNYKNNHIWKTEHLKVAAEILFFPQKSKACLEQV